MAGLKVALLPLPPAIGWRVLAAATMHLQCALHQKLWSRAAIKLGLINLACDCSKVRGGSVLGAGAVTKLGLIGQAFGCSMVQGGGRTQGGVLVSATGKFGWKVLAAAT